MRVGISDTSLQEVLAHWETMEVRVGISDTSLGPPGGCWAMEVRVGISDTSLQEVVGTLGDYGSEGWDL